MSIKLTYRAQTSIPVEVEGLTPDWACDKPLREIERFPIFHGNRQLPIAEMFEITGDADDKQFDFFGDLSGVHWIGAHMRSGRIFIHGPAGRHLGSEMRGGEIRIEGDAGGWLGCEMRGGFIHVQGNAGHLLGAAYRGSAKGMAGGTILVDGNVGNEAALSMQQGMILIGGDAGDMLGYNMTGGTVIVVGNSGIRVGAGMRGGVIAIFGSAPPRMLPSFDHFRTGPPESIRSLLLESRNTGLRFEEFQLQADFDSYVGDSLADGNGEISVRHIAS
jgi:formylmethanofuran dehydrogenase subunit C